MKDTRFIRTCQYRLAIGLLLLPCVVPLAAAANPWAGRASGDGAEERLREAQIDLDAPPAPRTKLVEGLHIGGDFELDFVRTDDLDLNRHAGDGVATVEPQLEVVFTYQPTDYVSAFLDLELETFVKFEDQTDRTDRDLELLVKQAHVTLGKPGDGLTARFGRQRMKDVREWFF